MVAARLAKFKPPRFGIIAKEGQIGLFKSLRGLRGSELRYAIGYNLSSLRALGFDVGAIASLPYDISQLANTVRRGITSIRESRIQPARSRALTLGTAKFMPKVRSAVPKSDSKVFNRYLNIYTGQQIQREIIGPISRGKGRAETFKAVFDPRVIEKEAEKFYGSQRTDNFLYQWQAGWLIRATAGAPDPIRNNPLAQARIHKEKHGKPLKKLDARFGIDFDLDGNFIGLEDARFDRIMSEVDKQSITRNQSFVKGVQNEMMYDNMVAALDKDNSSFTRKYRKEHRAADQARKRVMLRNYYNRSGMEVSVNDTTQYSFGSTDDTALEAAGLTRSDAGGFTNANLVNKANAVYFGGGYPRGDATSYGIPQVFTPGELAQRLESTMVDSKTAVLTLTLFDDLGLMIPNRASVQGSGMEALFNHITSALSSISNHSHISSGDLSRSSAGVPLQMTKEMQAVMRYVKGLSDYGHDELANNVFRAAFGQRLPLEMLGAHYQDIDTKAFNATGQAGPAPRRELRPYYTLLDMKDFETFDNLTGNFGNSEVRRTLSKSGSYDGIFPLRLEAHTKITNAYAQGLGIPALNNYVYDTELVDPVKYAFETFDASGRRHERIYEDYDKARRSRALTEPKFINGKPNPKFMESRVRDEFHRTTFTKNELLQQVKDKNFRQFLRSNLKAAGVGPNDELTIDEFKSLKNELWQSLGRRNKGQGGSGNPMPYSPTEAATLSRNDENVWRTLRLGTDSSNKIPDPLGGSFNDSWIFSQYETVKYNEKKMRVIKNEQDITNARHDRAKRLSSKDDHNFVPNKAQVVDSLQIIPITRKGKAFLTAEVTAGSSQPKTNLIADAVRDIYQLEYGGPATDKNGRREKRTDGMVYLPSLFFTRAAEETAAYLGFTTGSGRVSGYDETSGQKITAGFRLGKGKVQSALRAHRTKEEAEARNLTIKGLEGLKNYRKNLRTALVKGNNVVLDAYARKAAQRAMALFNSSSIGPGDMSSIIDAESLLEPSTDPMSTLMNFGTPGNVQLNPTALGNLQRYGGGGKFASIGTQGYAYANGRRSLDSFMAGSQTAEIFKLTNIDGDIVDMMDRVPYVKTFDIELYNKLMRGGAQGDANAYLKRTIQHMNLPASELRPDYVQGMDDFMRGANLSVINKSFSDLTEILGTSSITVRGKLFETLGLGKYTMVQKTKEVNGVKVNDGPPKAMFKFGSDPQVMPFDEMINVHNMTKRNNPLYRTLNKLNKRSDLQAYFYTHMMNVYENFDFIADPVERKKLIESAKLGAMKAANRTAKGIETVYSKHTVGLTAFSGEADALITLQKVSSILEIAVQGTIDRARLMKAALLEAQLKGKAQHKAVNNIIRDTFPVSTSDINRLANMDTAVLEWGMDNVEKLVDDGDGTVSFGGTIYNKEDVGDFSDPYNPIVVANASSGQGLEAILRQVQDEIANETGIEGLILSESGDDSNLIPLTTAPWNDIRQRFTQAGATFGARGQQLEADGLKLLIDRGAAREIGIITATGQKKGGGVSARDVRLSKATSFDESVRALREMLFHVEDQHITKGGNVHLNTVHFGKKAVYETRVDKNRKGKFVPRHFNDGRILFRQFMGTGAHNAFAIEGVTHGAEDFVGTSPNPNINLDSDFDTFRAIKTRSARKGGKLHYVGPNEFEHIMGRVATIYGESVVGDFLDAAIEFALTGAATGAQPVTKKNGKTVVVEEDLLSAYTRNGRDVAVTGGSANYNKLDRIKVAKLINHLILRYHPTSSFQIQYIAGGNITATRPTMTAKDKRALAFALSLRGQRKNNTVFHKGGINPHF